MSLLLGIDLGTASSKGVLVRPDGDVVAAAVRSRPRSMSMPHPGWAEVDAEAVWWPDVVELCRELLSHVEAQEIVAVVTVSGVEPCLVLTDEDGHPVRPAILYGIDMRATEEIAELETRLGADEVLLRCRTPLTTHAVGPKALWVRRREQQTWQRSRRWFSSSSYIAFLLTGEYVLDHHTASQCVPLYDITAQAWHASTYADLMDPLPQPRLAWAAEVVGTVTSGAAAVTGLPAGTPVCAGTVEAWAEALSAGVRGAGDVMLMYGSTIFFVQELDRLSPHPQPWNTLGVSPGSRCLAAGMPTSGTLTEWVRELTGQAPFETLIQEATGLPAGSDGLLLLPTSQVSEPPIFDRHARGVLAGLALHNTRGHMFRAAYEGIGYGIRQILDLLDTEANPVHRLVAVGGGTQGHLWTRSSATSRAGSSRCRSRPSAPATATRSWARSVLVSYQRRPTGRGRPTRSSPTLATGRSTTTCSRTT